MITVKAGANLIILSVCARFCVKYTYFSFSHHIKSSQINILPVNIMPIHADLLNRPSTTVSKDTSSSVIQKSWKNFSLKY